MGDKVQDVKFYAQSTFVLGKQAFKIGCNSASGGSYAVVAPAFGANLLEYVKDGKKLIFYDEDTLRQGDFTGTPVLFPTPNRVRDCRFSFEGVEYPQHKHGRPLFLHGLVFDEQFAFEPPQVKNDCVCFRCYIDFERGSEIYSSFPFECRLALKFILSRDGLKVEYTVFNKDTKRLPFGFALHPYFSAPKESDVVLRLNSNEFLECNEQILPSGRLLSVGQHFEGINTRGILVSELIADNDFLVLGEKAAALHYGDTGKTLTICTSPEFKHCVVYRPAGKEFVCVESQTCSIDAHNLYSKGLEDVSGLCIVPPKKSFSGFVYYEYK